MSTLLVATCLLACAASVLTTTSFIETDSIVFPESGNDTSASDATETQAKCINESKIEFNGECRTLLTTENVCPEGQWLVLDLFSASLPKPIIRGRCAPRRCEPKQHYWMEENRCVHENDTQRLCLRGNTVDTDMFGDGYCKCISQPVHARDRTGACYPVFRQGPCPQEQVWTGVGCRSDQCGVIRARFPQKIVVPWPDGQCYAVSEKGPCKQGDSVFIDVSSLTPVCGEPGITLILLAPTCNGADHSGKCTKPVNTTQNPFYAQVAEQVSKKRTRKGINNPK